MDFTLRLEISFKVPTRESSKLFELTLKWKKSDAKIKKERKKGKKLLGSLKFPNSWLQLRREILVFVLIKNLTFSREFRSLQKIIE